MSDRQVTSQREKKPYFCKICQVAFLNSDGLHFHCKDEEHIKMEEAYNGWNSGKLSSYRCLEDYILCPTRREPLIGLQYIKQIHPKVNRKGAFECSLCQQKGPLVCIMYHIGGLKHRDRYLSVAYKHLLSSYRKLHSCKDKKIIAREHAFKVEKEEKTLPANISAQEPGNNALGDCDSGTGKSDFWKLGIERQEKLEERKKLSACEAQKEKVLQYMETLVITSDEEADLVRNLTEQLEAAMDVFNWSTKPRYKSYKRERRSESSDGRYSRHPDIYPNKRRSIGYEKECKPSSSSSYRDEKQSLSGKHYAAYEGRSRSASRDMSLKVTFSTGSENEAKATDVEQELQEPSTSCPIRGASGNLSEATESSWHPSNVSSDFFRTIRAKRRRKRSTDVERWESLFANHHPETSGSMFSWGRKSPSLNTEEFPSDEKKKITRRASLVALSAFTLFSQEEQEQDPASCPRGDDKLSEPRSPGDNMSQDKGPQLELKQVWNKDQESPCSSDAASNEAGTMGDEVMQTEPEQLDEKCKSIPNMPKSHGHLKAGTSCGPLSDVNDVAQAPESSYVLEKSSEYSDLEACGSRHLDTKSDGQDADSSVCSKTLTSGKLYASGRQLSPQVLQLFKGKDTNSIVRVLNTLCPFYPALQELDLQVFAEGLSKTGALPK